MHSKIKRLYIFILLPFLLGANHSELTEKDIINNRDYYEVIEATTGKTEASQFYAEDKVIKTHIITTSAIKKALAKKGINISNVKIFLYYDPIAIRDDSPPRIWNSKSHPNTISSPWLDLTKIVTASGETRISIRIDATAARSIRDLFSQSEKKSNASRFLDIPSVTERCLNWMSTRYIEARFKGGLTPDSPYYCVPEELREPLLFLFGQAKLNSYSSIAFASIYELDYYCQNAAREYYSELYPRLAVKALQILESQSEYDIVWWKEVIEKVKPIKECE